MHKWHLSNKSKIDRVNLEKEVFTLIDFEKLKENKELIKNLDKLEINYLDKLDYICPDFKNKKCFGVTDTFEKIYFDGSHTTVEGAKFFGKIIYESNWLNKITK